MLAQQTVNHQLLGLGATASAAERLVARGAVGRAGSLVDRVLRDESRRRWRQRLRDRCAVEAGRGGRAGRPRRRNSHRLMKSHVATSRSVKPRRTVDDAVSAVVADPARERLLSESSACARRARSCVGHCACGLIEQGATAHGSRLHHRGRGGDGRGGVFHDRQWTAALAELHEDRDGMLPGLPDPEDTGSNGAFSLTPALRPARDSRSSLSAGASCCAPRSRRPHAARWVEAAQQSAPRR